MITFFSLHAHIKGAPMRANAGSRMYTCQAIISAAAAAAAAAAAGSGLPMSS
jgi:hypothetical protein